MTSVVREVTVDRLAVPDSHAAAARPPHIAADGQPARIRSSSLSSSSSTSTSSSAAASGNIEEAVTPPPSSPKVRHAVLYEVGRQFDPHAHWYPRALNAQLHPMVSTFLSLGNERIAERYHHLNPAVNKAALLALLRSDCKYFQWSGADLFNVTNSRGKRQMVVIETNSCPSGQKSMPPANMEAEDDGYHTLMRVRQRRTDRHREQNLIVSAAAIGMLEERPRAREADWLLLPCAVVACCLVRLSDYFPPSDGTLQLGRRRQSQTARMHSSIAIEATCSWSCQMQESRESNPRTEVWHSLSLCRSMWFDGLFVTAAM